MFFTTLVLFLLLFGNWIIFSGHFSVFFLALGVISCLISIILARRLGIKECEFCRFFQHIRSVGYVFWLVKEIIISSIDVARRVWQAEPDISPSLDWVPSTQSNDAGRTLFANSITLTPGTVSIIVREQHICVHALCKTGIDDLVEGNMDRKVAAISSNGGQ